MKFKSIKGTKDILPPEGEQWHAVEETIRAVMHRFNYREIRTPVFEETALFSRSIGELTDIVGKEMYTFTDRSESSLTLRPEMTASVMRAYIQHNLGELSPLTKVFYIAPMFRQERPQAGRLRQFHQFGAEATGSSAATVDAEIIALSAEVYRTLGVGNFTIKINSVGCEQCRPPYRERLQEFLRAVYDQLSEESKKRFEQNPLRILDSKDENDQKLTLAAPLMKDHLCPECGKHFKELQSSLTALQIAFEIDGRIVRGLDYYTKTAFEIVSTDLGSQDALAGGGRYDLLIQQLGGKETPSVGFAAGMERLMLVLDRQRLTPPATIRPLIFLAAADEAGRSWAWKTLLELRRKGIASEMDHLGRSVKAQMREADRQQARFALVVGENELQRNLVTLKDMSKGEHREVPLDRFIEEAERRRDQTANE
jgi:histidyl-tRNA synthetase